MLVMLVFRLYTHRVSRSYCSVLDAPLHQFARGWVGSYLAGAVDHIPDDQALREEWGWKGCTICADGESCCFGHFKAKWGRDELGEIECS